MRAAPIGRATRRSRCGRTTTASNASSTASAPGQREALKGAVARHIDRFAFREAPLTFDWQDQG